MVGEGEEGVAPIAGGLLDELDHLELSPAAVQTMMAVADRPLRELFSYCFSGRPTNEKGLAIAMRRFIAVAWMLHSEMLVGIHGRPLTLEELGKLPRIDCTKCTLSILAQNFGKQWGFHTRVQKRLGGKTNYAAAAKRGWEKRGRRAAPKKPKERKCRTCGGVKPISEFGPRRKSCKPCEALPEMRTCSHCHVPKPISEFGYRHRRCWGCASKDHRNHQRFIQSALRLIPRNPDGIALETVKWVSNSRAVFPLSSR